MYSEAPKSFNIGGISTCTANLPRVSILGECLRVQQISLRVSILGEFLHVQRISLKSFNIGGISTCTANLSRVSILGEFLHVQQISQEFQYWGNFYMYSESPKSFNTFFLCFDLTVSGPSNARISLT